ncbi:peptide chain release factor 1 [candidate division WOR-3 bacterium]|nr:peptide chain release factor 1 [candidate division WOR-3 bacterium]
MDLLDKLKSMEAEKSQLEHKLLDRAILADPQKMKPLTYRHKRCEEILAKGDELRKVIKEMEDTEEMLSRGEEDKEFLEGLRCELATLEEQRNELTSQLEALLIPQDERWQRNCIIEIRGAAGGDESTLFAADLFRMYTHYVDRKRWKLEILSSNPTEVGGFKEIIFLIKGEEAYKYMRFESGVHRVQRVPQTEASGRIHTSTVTVAVLAEAAEQDVEIDPKDLQVDTFRASGRGGQHVNVTDSAVRITHKPSGIVVSCQDERSQHQNRAKAMRILLARLEDLTRRQQEAKTGAARKAQIGTGERSEKIRTYNFPQNRVTDHRIKVSLYKLEEVISGDLQGLHSLLLEEEAKRYVQAGD